MLSGLALKTKITFFAIAIFIALSAIALLGLQSLRHASESDNIARINQLMKSTTNIVEQFELMVKNGQLEEAQAKKLAIQVLRENKYHDSEYVYVVDNNLDFVATPHDPELHGTSFNDFKDASGLDITQTTIEPYIDDLAPQQDSFFELNVGYNNGATNERAQLKYAELTTNGLPSVQALNTAAGIDSAENVLYLIFKNLMSSLYPLLYLYLQTKASQRKDYKYNFFLKLATIN